jgi:hypothetical protein
MRMASALEKRRISKPQSLGTTGLVALGEEVTAFCSLMILEVEPYLTLPFPERGKVGVGVHFFRGQ